MTEAQKEALRLLECVDHICSQNGWRYTLGNRALVNFEYNYGTEYFNPNSITICLPYDNYIKLMSYIDTYKTTYGLEIMDYQNSENFDSLSSWVMYSGKSLLPPDRKKDECYYKTRLVVTPMFPAGNSIRECKKTGKYIINTFKYIDCRMPLPRKRLFCPIKGKIMRTKQRIYCVKRNRVNTSIENLIEVLVKKETKANYYIYKNVGNTVAWMCEKEFDVERVYFYGIETYAIKARKEFIERNYNVNSNSPVDKVSELILRGGRDLRRVQLIQLDMMKEIDRICRKHNLKYNIAFGTLLGAVRHKGFIPWDDDADINMPYEDYLKLIEVIDGELDGEKYYFRYQDKEEDCNITYAHLKRNGTIYTKRGRDGFKYHPGVFIDIVPIFNGAPNFLFHSIQTHYGWKYRRACWAYIGANSERKTLKRAYYKRLAKIGNKTAYRKFIKVATFFKHKRNKMLFLNGLDRSPYNVGFVKRECFDEPMEIEFEGYKFFAPKDCVSVLNYCYGKDFMKYLPILKREPKNDALIELGDLYSDI